MVVDGRYFVRVTSNLGVEWLAKCYIAQNIKDETGYQVFHVENLAGLCIFFDMIDEN